MSRIPLITTRDQLDPDARDAYERIVESRGEMVRPFQVLLHPPAVADRELVTLATGRAHGCAFVWESHLQTALEAGVPPDTIAKLEGGRRGLGEREEALVSFVDELRETGTASGRAFPAVPRLLGP